MRKVRLPEKPRTALVVRRGIWLWLVLILAALVFTQALRSPASTMLFVFTAALPPIMLLYLLLARVALKVYLEADELTVEKNTPVTYEFRIINESPLPFPFADAYVTLPQENRVRCAERPMRMALSPFSTYRLQNRIAFACRGTYEIGVGCIYVYDFFRIFGLRVDIGLYNTVFVTPRRRFGEESAAIASADETVSNRRSTAGYDRLDIGDMREYRIGDTLKSIHWKLSARSDEPIVREFNAGQTQTVYLFCDLAAHFPTLPPQKPVEKKKKKRKKDAEPEAEVDPLTLDPHTLATDADYEDMNEFAADGVVELAVSAALRELRRGNRVVLLWYDDRAEHGAYAETLEGLEDFELIWRRFATAPLCAPTDDVTHLTALLPEMQSAKQIFVTAHLDAATMAGYCALPGVQDDHGAAEVILFHPRDRFAHSEARRRFLDTCAARLAESGVVYTERSAA